LFDFNFSPYPVYKIKTSKKYLNVNKKKPTSTKKPPFPILESFWGGGVLLCSQKHSLRLGLNCLRYGSPFPESIPKTNNPFKISTELV